MGSKIDTAWYWEIEQNTQWEPYDDITAMKIEMSYYHYTETEDKNLRQFNVESGGRVYTLDFEKMI